MWLRLILIFMFFATSIINLLSLQVPLTPSDNGYSVSVKVCEPSAYSFSLNPDTPCLFESTIRVFHLIFIDSRKSVKSSLSTPSLAFEIEYPP